MQVAEVLVTLHGLLEPRTYLQLGLDHPELISLAHCGTVGVAPAPRVEEGAHVGKLWLKLYAMERDAFFTAEGREQVLDGEPLDLAVIEGGPPLSQLARDLDHIARWAHTGTYVLVLSEESRAAELTRLAHVARLYCPNLQVQLIAAVPTPLLLLTGFVPMRDERSGLVAAIERDMELGTEVPATAPVPLHVAIPALTRDPVPVVARLDRGAWIPRTGNRRALEPVAAGVAPGPRIVFESPVRHAFRAHLTLSLRGMEVLRLGVRSAVVGGMRRERNVWLDVARPGALHHELERVALYTNPALAFFELELEGALAAGEELDELTLVPADADWRDVPAGAEMAIELLRVDAAQIPAVRHVTRFVPEHFADRSVPQRRRDRPRDAVLFAWFVPAQMPELGEYYLGLLRYSHPDAKLFIGMNHGSDPIWEERFRESGLDVEVRWARPEIDDYWDTTGFLTALEGFHQSDESFALVWFGHSKGGSREFADYAQVRFAQMRTFWARRAQIERIFTDPQIGLVAPRYNLTPPYPFPGPWKGWTDELAALQRVYRDHHAPLGLSALDTFYVLRGTIVRGFCHAVGTDFFRTDPEAYGANKWFFEMAFPSIASMQGFTPFIDMDVPGANDPRDDLMVSWDVKQTHRLAKAEVARWRAGPTAFQPRLIPWDRPAWNRPAPMSAAETSTPTPQG